MSSNNPYGSGYGTQTSGLSRQAPAAAASGRPAPAPSHGGAGQPGAGAGADLVKDTTTANFAADVIQPSRTQPVLVDFWAPWCGPCKQLTPILERVVQAAGGRVRLVKMNIDDHPSIAGQLGVQSIPAVFAFVNGQPVDGFMGALPESEVKAFVDRLTGGAAPVGDPVAEALEEAKALLGEGDAAEAAQLFAVVLQHAPDSLAAVAGLTDCYLALGDAVRARAILDQAPADKADDPALATVRTRLKLAEEIARLGDAATLKARLAADAGDHRARFDLALIEQAKGERAAAAAHLLEIVRRDRAWEDDGARRKLLEFFEAWGGADPATKDARRKLSTLLFS